VKQVSGRIEFGTGTGIVESRVPLVSPVGDGALGSGALVAEGATDYEIIHTAPKAILPRPFVNDAPSA